MLCILSCPGSHYNGCLHFSEKSLNPLYLRFSACGHQRLSWYPAKKMVFSLYYQVTTMDSLRFADSSDSNISLPNEFSWSLPSTFSLSLCSYKTNCSDSNCCFGSSASSVLDIQQTEVCSSTPLLDHYAASSVSLDFVFDSFAWGLNPFGWKHGCCGPSCLELEWSWPWRSDSAVHLVLSPLRIVTQGVASLLHLHVASLVSRCWPSSSSLIDICRYEQHFH